MQVINVRTLINIYKKISSQILHLTYRLRKKIIKWEIVRIRQVHPKKEKMSNSTVGCWRILLINITTT